MAPSSEDKVVLQQFLSGVWWLVLLRGIAVGILGWLLLTRPAITVLVIVQLMGIYWLVDGIFTLRGRSKDVRPTRIGGGGYSLAY